MLVYFVMDAHIYFTHMGVPSNLGAVLERARVQPLPKGSALFETTHRRAMAVAM